MTTERDLIAQLRDALVKTQVYFATTPNGRKIFKDAIAVANAFLDRPAKPMRSAEEVWKALDEAGLITGAWSGMKLSDLLDKDRQAFLDGLAGKEAD